MSYATYDSYRDSGVVWLGDVPSHWEVKRLKFLIDYIQTGSTPPSSQQEYYSSEDVDWYNPSDFNDDSLLLKNPSKKISQIAVDDNVVKKLPNQSILIIGIGATLGKVGLVEKSCSTNQQINAIVTNKYCRPKFIAYALFVQRDIMKLISSSATLSIMNQEKTKSLILAVPSFEEQTAIVTYLDSQLSQIDALIGKQQSLLEKLAEQRTATITQAVTKGLNPDVLMKDSGVAWLGEVPKGWVVKQNNQIFKIHNGATPKTSEPDYWGSDINWFTPKDLGDCQNKEIGESAKMITELGYQSCGVSLAPKNSIALSKRAPIGHLAITTVPAVVNQGCFLLEILYKDSVNYLY